MKKILILEDEDYQVLKENLEEENFDVDVVDNALDAYSLLIYEKKEYDLIILDLLMNGDFLVDDYPDEWRGHGGLCVLKELKNQNKDINILVYSYDDNPKIIKAVEETGVKFIPKMPSTRSVSGFNELIEEVKKLLNFEK